MISSEVMLNLLLRREIRARLRIAGIRIYEKLLTNETSNLLILNHFLYSMNGKEEGSNISLKDKIQSYHHYTKGIKGCTICTNYKLYTQFLSFLKSFKNSMCICYSKEVYFININSIIMIYY